MRGSDILRSLSSCFILSLLVIHLCTSSLYAEGGVVLSLSGGGTRGLAHIGVLEVLEENHIPVAGIVGTSIGAIIGGLYASGYKAEQLRDIISGTDLTDLLSHPSERIFVALGREQLSPGGLPWISLNEKGQITGPLGSASGVELLDRFAQLALNVDVVNFSNLCIPFAAIATDLETGKKVVLRRGSLASAMRASMAIPAIFEPWPIEGKLLVDGGLVSNMPVSTARELFPGYPVIAVNVTSPLLPRKNLRSIIDVVDQSITIMTMQNIDREIATAEIVIRPDINENIPLLDVSRSSEIIHAGRIAIEDDIPLILKLVQQAPPIECAGSPVLKIVDEIMIRGFPPVIQTELEKQYKDWTGLPVDTGKILDACNELKSRDDVFSVEYYIEESENTVRVVLEVQRKPAYEIKMGGYATNLHPNRWLRFNLVRRDYISYGDKLLLDLRIGDQWGLGLDYMPSADDYGSWRLSLSAEKWDLTPSNSPFLEWEEYSMVLSHLFKAGLFDLGLGLVFELNTLDDFDNSFWGPLFFASIDTFDKDKKRGMNLTSCIWWPDTDEPVMRTEFTSSSYFSDKWSSAFRAGFAEGDLSNPGLSVYLGAREELYSYADNPVRAERMAWTNMVLRKELFSSWWGRLTADFMAGYGYAWDDEWEGITEVWEAGLGFSVPGYFFDGKFLILWNEEDDFTLGFTLGNPLWGSCPLRY